MTWLIVVFACLLVIILNFIFSMGVAYLLYLVWNACFLPITGITLPFWAIVVIMFAISFTFNRPKS